MQVNQPDHPENAIPGIGHDFRFRRKPAACEACYRRKTRCDLTPSSEKCTQCLRRNVICKIPPDKGIPDNPRKRARYIRNLEERLRRTEALLSAAGILVEPDLDSSGGSGDEADHDVTMEDSNAPYQQDADSDADSPISLPKQSFGSNTSSRTNDRRRSNTQKNGPPVYRAEKGNSLYYGRSTPLSILTREGVEWVRHKSGEANSLNALLSNSKFDSPWAHWRPDVFYDVFSSEVFKPLPPRAEVFSLLEDYFGTVNLIFPLYHEKTFMQLVEWQYTQQTCDDAARWASINIILALAYEYRFSNSQKSEKDREKAWLYYKNALSVFPELVLRRTDLLSVQALLGMALFLRGNSGSQSTVPIVTAAIRASHRMGLHREILRPHLSQEDQQQRKNVFWIAYFLDQSISIRLGNAPTQHFDDFDVEFPSNDTVEGLMMAENKAFFPQLCRIAVIRSRIYSNFYSARALEGKSTAVICEAIHKLHAELQEWKTSSQFDTLFKRGASEEFLAGFASAGLFLMYYNSLIMVHRLPLLLNFVYQSRAESIAELDLRLILNQSSSSAAVCVQAARDTLKLVNNLPWGDIAWIWSLLYYVFLAVMTIFANILRNSQQPMAKDDLQSLNMAATFFATLVPADGPCNYARFMTRMSTTFERIARAVFERDQKMLIKPGPEPKGKGSKSRAAGHSRSKSHPQSQPQLQSYSSSSPNRPVSANTVTAVNIPNLEGLPPINSAGYVVPENPTPSPSSNQTSPSASSHIARHSFSTPRQFAQHQQHPSNPSVFSQPQSQPHYQTQPTPTSHIPHFPTSTMNINPNTNMQSHIPFPMPLDDTPFTFPQPELWQIPLTADWEFGFGSQFLSNMFAQSHPGSAGAGANPSHGQNQPYVFQAGGGTAPIATGSAPNTVPVSMPTPMINGTATGYGYGTGGSNANGHPNTQPQPQPHPAMWMGGNFGPF